jgi:hypothetical protein
MDLTLNVLKIMEIINWIAPLKTGLLTKSIVVLVLKEFLAFRHSEVSLTCTQESTILLYSGYNEIQSPLLHNTYLRSFYIVSSITWSPKLPLFFRFSNWNLIRIFYIPLKNDWASAKLLLVLASIVTFGSESHGTHDHILLPDDLRSLQIH